MQQIQRIHERPRRVDWTLASPHTKWMSCRVGDVTPTAWYGWLFGQNVLLLKDTRKGNFCNTLLDDGCSFLYELPQPKTDPQRTMVLQLHSEAVSQQKSIEIRLFCVECANNFYLGEFAVVGVEQVERRNFVRLHRLCNQDEHVRSSYAVMSRPKRSRSESRHAEVVARLLPGWKMLHEPECVSFYDNELVVHGMMRKWGGDQYVCDYVAARGSQRVCIESKAAADGLDDAAKQKARALRDHSLTRVVALIDHDERFSWYDFGCPSTREETEGTELAALRSQLHR